MKNRNRFLGISLALLINTGVITACSQQAPNTSPDNAVQLNQNQNAINSETGEMVSAYRDDEISIQDSEVITDEQSGFSTQAAKGNGNGNSKGNSDKAGDEKSGKGNGNAFGKAKQMNKDERETKITGQERAMLNRLRQFESKLNLKNEIKKEKLEKLKRKNTNVKTSDVTEVKNADGTTTKIIVVRFTDADNVTVRENKIARTFSADGKLLKAEHYLTVTAKNHSRTYTRIVTYNPDGSKNILISSETKWQDGKTRKVTEERNIDASGNGTGTGTITITYPDGKVVTYDIKITITGGNINVEPTPAPSPSPTVSPSISPVPTASPSPSLSPAPTATPTATPVPTATPTASPTATPVPTATPTASPSV